MIRNERRYLERKKVFLEIMRIIAEAVMKTDIWVPVG